MHSTKAASYIIILLLGVSLASYAQDKTAIEKKLTSQYTLTKTTADRTDIVTAGSVLVLKKDNLLMVDVSNSNLFQNNYKDGKISQNALGKIARFHLPGVPAAPSSGGAQRTFVAGEKVWITKIEVRDNGVNVNLYSDAINDVRYAAALSLAFKGSAPIDEQAEKLVAEVFDVQPSDDSSGNGGEQQPAQAGGGRQSAQGGAPAQSQQQADTPPAPIPPPPPPSDAAPVAPKTIALGQTKETVVANFGQPGKIAKVGTKEIYSYPDIKVTFVNGKVTDVQ